MSGRKSVPHITSFEDCGNSKNRVRKSAKTIEDYPFMKFQQVDWLNLLHMCNLLKRYSCRTINNNPLSITESSALIALRKKYTKNCTATARKLKLKLSLGQRLRQPRKMLIRLERRPCAHQLINNMPKIIWRKSLLQLFTILITNYVWAYTLCGGCYEIVTNFV